MAEVAKPTHPVRGEVLADEKKTFIFPAVHYVMPEEQRATAIRPTVRGVAPKRYL